MTHKIMHVIGQLVRGGAEKQLVYLAKALQEQGWPQVIVSFNPGDALENELLASGIPVYGIKRRANKLLRLWELQKIIKVEQPSILHSWSSFTHVYIRWIVMKDPTPQKIVSFRGNPAIDNFGHPVQRIPYASIYQYMDCVVSNSQAAIDEGIRGGIKLSRVEVVGNFVFPQGGARPGLTTKEPVIAAVGALIPLKAYDVLFLALSEVTRKGRAYRLLLAGDGPERGHLASLAAKLNIAHNIRFLGEIENVRNLLQKAHLFVHPSRSEGLSNAIMEAMGEGLPVIAANVGGNPEIVKNGKNGILVPVDDPDALSLAIMDLLISPELRMKLGSSGSAIIREKFGFSKVLSQYMDMYLSLASVCRNEKRC